MTRIIKERKGAKRASPKNFEFDLVFLCVSKMLPILDNISLCFVCSDLLFPIEALKIDIPYDVKMDTR
jgi:hypothetical protein